MKLTKIKKLVINVNNITNNKQIYKITGIKINNSRKNIRKNILDSPLKSLKFHNLSSQNSYKKLSPIKLVNNTHNNNESVDLELERKRKMEELEQRYRKRKLDEEKRQKSIEDLFLKRKLELEEIKRKKDEERKKYREMLQMSAGRNKE